MKASRPYLPVYIIILFCAVLLVTGSVAAQKMKPPELIEKHLASIGSPELLGQRVSTAGSALARVDFIVGGSGHLEGNALLGSEDSRAMVLMEFGRSTYQREHFLFDGKDTQVSFMTPGVRSPLGRFLFTYKYLLKDGLFGGTLTTRWPLLDPEVRKAKLKYGGLKKADGKKLHRLNYRSKGGSDVQIRLFFDPDTFRHVRTEYAVDIAPLIGATPGASSQQRPTRFRVVETFEEFSESDGLVAPTVWKIHYSRTGGNQGQEIWKWILTFNKFAHNQTIEEGYYTLITERRN